VGSGPVDNLAFLVGRAPRGCPQGAIRCDLRRLRNAEPLEERGCGAARSRQSSAVGVGGGEVNGRGGNWRAVEATRVRAAPETAGFGIDELNRSGEFVVGCLCFKDAGLKVGGAPGAGLTGGPAEASVDEDGEVIGKGIDPDGTSFRTGVELNGGCGEGAAVGMELQVGVVRVSGVVTAARVAAKGGAAWAGDGMAGRFEGPSERRCEAVFSKPPVGGVLDSSRIQAGWGGGVGDGGGPQPDEIGPSERVPTLAEHAVTPGLMFLRAAVPGAIALCNLSLGERSDVGAVPHEIVVGASAVPTLASYGVGREGARRNDHCEAVATGNVN